MPTRLYIMQLTMKEVVELSIIYLARVASTKMLSLLEYEGFYLMSLIT